jgi:hypothetical protein
MAAVTRRSGDIALGAHQLGLGDDLAVDQATALNFQMLRIWRRMRTCRCNWSPAVTVFLKRALSIPTK